MCDDLSIAFGTLFLHMSASPFILCIIGIHVCQRHKPIQLLHTAVCPVVIARKTWSLMSMGFWLSSTSRDWADTEKLKNLDVEAIEISLCCSLVTICIRCACTSILLHCN